MATTRIYYPCYNQPGMKFKRRSFKISLPLSLQKAELAPNVLAMVRASNEFAMLVPSEVLAETTPQARAKVISIFIKVCAVLISLV